MPTEAKAKVIEQARDWYSRSVGVVFTDYRGLKVKQLQELRANLRAKGGEIHVIKNTLFRAAAGEDINSIPEELHNGPTAVAFIYENESECTKVLFDYASSSKTLKVKGGFLNGKALGEKEIEAISKLPSRDVLIAQVIGTIAAPLSNLVGVIEALYADPIRTIGAVADKVAEGSPIKKAAAPVAPEEQTAPAAAEPAATEAIAEPAMASEDVAVATDTSASEGEAETTTQVETHAETSPESSEPSIEGSPTEETQDLQNTGE